MLLTGFRHLVVEARKTNLYTLVLSSYLPELTTEIFVNNLISNIFHYVIKVKKAFIRLEFVADKQGAVNPTMNWSLIEFIETWQCVSSYIEPI